MNQFDLIFLYTLVQIHQQLLFYTWDRNATQTEIKEAYRKLAFTLHPDRHDGCEIKTNQFKNATEAYQTLSGVFLLFVFTKVNTEKKLV